MKYRVHVVAPVLVVALCCLSNLSSSQSESLSQSSRLTSRRIELTPKNAMPNGNTALWRQPTDISSRDMLDGKGGKADRPHGPFTFLREKTEGTNPKFIVMDSNGSKWIVKLGPEARSETTATRLVWAVGYFTDEDYFIPEISVRGMKRLTRGQEFVSKNGTVRGARLERRDEGRKKVGNWSWRNNPFSNTKEFRGLVVMMSLINNWDLKKENNAIIRDGKEYQYLVGDLGASFGNAGIWNHSKGNLIEYRRSKFVKNISEEDIDLRLSTRPPLKFLFLFPLYIQRSRLANLAEDLHQSDVQWIGHLLTQLSSRQIAEAFRAGGFGSDEVEGFTQEVRERINELNRL